MNKAMTIHLPLPKKKYYVFSESFQVMNEKLLLKIPQKFTI